MLFWIILAVIAAAFLGTTFIYWLAEHKRGWFDAGDAWGAGGFALVLAVVVGFFAFGVAMLWATSGDAGDSDQRFTASSSGLETLALNEQQYSESSGGMFLLLGGYSSESGTATTVAYIDKAQDGGMTIQEAELSEARIFEDATTETARVDIINYARDVSWVAPWMDTYILNYSKVYEFHVPPGTVVTGYNIDITQ